MDKTVYTFPKNKYQDIRVSVREYKGKDLIDIRTWTMTQGSNDKIPTAKGIALKLSLIKELKIAIEKVEEAIKDMK